MGGEDPINDLDTDALSCTVADRDFNQDHHSFVAERCTKIPQLLVWERKEKLKLGLK